MARIVADNLADTLDEVSDFGDVLRSVYWCDHCHIPLLGSTCSLCGSVAKRCAKDMKPVFPRERQLLEEVVGRELPSFLFRSANRVLFDGKTLFSVHTHAEEGPRLAGDKTRRLDALQAASSQATVDSDDRSPSTGEGLTARGLSIYDDAYGRLKWEQCNRANHASLQILVREAVAFVKRQASRFPARQKLISFSGGKDSAATASLVSRALGPIPLLFGNTTIEFPETLAYIENFARNHGFILVQEKPDADFLSLCDVLGPPSRLMRWCCTVCKSRPINKYYARLSGDVLSYDGIRRLESVRRARYPRVAQVRKFSRQVAARPILHWSSFAVWLYIFSEGIEYNPLYEYGYGRVGCVHCPSNTPYNEYLTKINFPELYDSWIDYLTEYARGSGKAEPERYARESYWKARNITKQRSIAVEPDQPCGAADGVVYLFNDPITPELVQFLKPFGSVSTLEEGGKETFFIGGGNPLLISGVVGQEQLSVSLEEKGTRLIRMRIEKQIEKYLNCVHCGGCAGVCTQGAIEIRDNRYYIDGSRCTRCGRCVTTKYLKEGCVALNFGTAKKSVRR